MSSQASADSMIDAYRREVATQTERADKAEAENQQLREERDGLARARNAAEFENQQLRDALRHIADDGFPGIADYAREALAVVVEE
jgi:predicted  nucleic acid-binding Zn-ribbon protein